jgi:hypothetical protein
MRIARQVLGAATIVLASFLALSCNNAYGIFQEVQGEQKQNGSKVFQETTATNAFRLDNGTNKYYYASTVRLYRRLAADSSWSQVNVGGSSSYTLRSVVLMGTSSVGTIYALVGDKSSDMALYSSTDGDAWAKEPLPPSPMSSGTFYLDALFAADNHLYAEGHVFVPDTSTGNGNGKSYYTLYYFSGAAFSPVNAAFTNILTTIRGVVSDKNDGTGTSHWFAATDRLYEGASADGTGATQVTDVTLSGLSTKTIWGISYTGGHLYVATKDGYLYQDSGTAKEVNSDSLPLTAVISVPPTIGSFILVGTDTVDVSAPAVGYYEGTFPSLDVDSSSPVVARTSSIYSTTVKGFPVHAFYYDGDGSSGNLFVCISPGVSSSNNYGLYESTWDGSAWSGWSAQ